MCVNVYFMHKAKTTTMCSDLAYRSNNYESPLCIEDRYCLISSCC